MKQGVIYVPGNVPIYKYILLLETMPNFNIFMISFKIEGDFVYFFNIFCFRLSLLVELPRKT